jgi:hypothetical protein
MALEMVTSVSEPLSNTVFVRVSALPQANLSDDEVIALGLNQEKYYGMSGTAARIWGLLEAETTLDQLCARLLDEFDVPKDVCLQQTREFVDKLILENLVRIAPRR